MSLAAKILVVDDEPDIRSILQDILQDEGYDVATAQDAESARDAFKTHAPDLVLLDIWMPNEDGISVLKHWVDNKALKTTPVIMISGHGTVENAVEAVKLGAYDFLEKPLSTGKLLLSVERGLENASLRAENRRLKSKLATKSDLIAMSEASQELARHIQLLGPTDSWVFITGETGTGKRLVAQQIHQHSPRADGPFIELNLAVLPTEHVAQQLFGAQQGDDITLGSFESAAGGTLYINEVLGLNLETQHKLLSALQEQQFMRIGGNEYIELDVRVVVTTSGNPQEAVSKGSFLEDLYFRLNVIPIQVPALRERRRDLPELITVFVEEIAHRNQLPTPGLRKDAIKSLVSYDWPGNVRQLKNVLQRLLLLHPEQDITAAQVNDALGGDRQLNRQTGGLQEFMDDDLRAAKEKFERAYLKHHLKTVDGNVSELSKKIGMERTHLYRKLKHLDINTKEL